MTNLEKFQEIFGITIDDRFVRSLGGQCKILDLIDPTKYKCEEYDSCHECPLFRFWDKEYVERVKFNCGEVEYIKNDEDATYEWGTKFVKEAIEHVEKEAQDD